MWNDQRQGFGGGGGGFAPVKEGEEIEVTIEAVGAKGDGIAKKEGFVIFVPDTKQGDKVRVRITRVLSRVGFGQVIGAGTAKEDAPAADGEPAAADEESTPSPKKEEDFFEGHEDTEDFGEEAEEEKKE